MRPLLILLVLLGAAAGAVHFFVVPLDVLLAWRKPARVFIATDPSGATLRLDGTPLDGTSPTAVEVARDRREHVLEAAKPGFRPARQAVRYDRAVRLTVRLALEPETPTPAPPATRPQKSAPAPGRR